MNNLITFIKAPLYYGKICKIYPPSVAEVIGLPYFPQYRKILTVSQDDIAEELTKKNKSDEKLPTPFEFLLINCYYNKDFYRLAQEAFEFFLHEKVIFDIQHKVILIGDSIIPDINSEMQKNISPRMIKEEDYFYFQNLIRQACGDKELKEEPPPDPNEDPRVRRIKEKAKLRDRIKARKGVQGGISLEACLISICCMGIGITPLNIGEMSYAAIGPLLKVYQNKEKYDLDIRSLLAGADSKKIKPKYWIRNTD